MEGKKIVVLLIYSITLVDICLSIDRVIRHRCAVDETSADNMIMTIRILPNDEGFHSVYAFDALANDVEDTDNRIAACTVDSSGISDPLTDTVSIVAIIDTTATVHDCGARVYSDTVDGATVYYADFLFHVYSSAITLIDAEDETVQFTCSSDDLNPDFVTTGAVDNVARTPGYRQQPQFGAYLRVLDATSEFPVSTTTVGDNVILSLDFFPALERGPDNCGTRFFIGFLGNDAITAASAASLFIKVYPMYPVTTNVRVIARDMDEMQTSLLGEVLTFNFDVDLMGCSEGADVEKDNKGIDLNSYDHEVCVLVFNQESDTEEYFTALPVDVTGTSYDVVTMDTSDGAEVMVVSSEDSTSVSMTLPTGASAITYDGTTYSAGDTLTLTLDQGETLHLSQATSLSGTSITSTLPISVFTGNQNYMDNLVTEQLPPKSSFGENYVLVPVIPAYPGVTYQESTIYIIRITATGSTTIVKQYTGTNTVTSTTLDDATPQMTVTVPHDSSAFEIEADNPVSVNLFFSPPASNSQFQSAMATVPAVSQWAPSYTFIAPASSFTQPIIVQKTAASINGVNDQTVSQIMGADAVLGPSGYVFKSDAIFPEDVWSISSDDELSPFMVLILTYSTDESTDLSAMYNPFRQRLPVYNKCVIPGRLGDILDNDCDGRIDEEIKNDKDDDGDGKVDEDQRASSKDSADPDETAPTGTVSSGSSLFTEHAGVVAVRPINCKVSGNPTFNAPTFELTGADGCPKTGNGPFIADSNFDPQTGVNIGDADELKVLHSGKFVIAKFLNHPKLYFMCELEYCFAVDDTKCTTDICIPAGSPARRRRQSSSNKLSNVTSEVWVYPYRNIKSEVIMVPSKNTLNDCLENDTIQIAGSVLLTLSLISVFASCCFCLLLRRRWNSKKKRSEYTYSTKFSPSWTTQSRRH